MSNIGGRPPLTSMVRRDAEVRVRMTVGDRADIEAIAAGWDVAVAHVVYVALRQMLRGSGRKEDGLDRTQSIVMRASKRFLSSLPSDMSDIR